VDVHIRGTRLTRCIEERFLDCVARLVREANDVPATVQREGTRHCQAMMTLFWKRRAATTKRKVPMAKSAKASIHKC
jgi:hypothetical protein